MLTRRPLSTLRAGNPYVEADMPRPILSDEKPAELMMTAGLANGHKAANGHTAVNGHANGHAAMNGHQAPGSAGSLQGLEATAVMCEGGVEVVRV